MGGERGVGGGGVCVLCMSDAKRSASERPSDYYSTPHLLEAFHQSLDLLGLLSLRRGSPGGGQGLRDVGQRFVDLGQSHGGALCLWRGGRVGRGDGAQLLLVDILLQLLFQGPDVLLLLQLGSHLLDMKKCSIITPFVSHTHTHTHVCTHTHMHTHTHTNTHTHAHTHTHVHLFMSLLKAHTVIAQATA